MRFGSKTCHTLTIFEDFMRLSRALADRSYFSHRILSFTSLNCGSESSELPRADRAEFLEVHTAGAVFVGGGDERLAISSGDVVSERHAEGNLKLALVQLLLRRVHSRL